MKHSSIRHRLIHLVRDLEQYGSNPSPDLLESLRENAVAGLRRLEAEIGGSEAPMIDDRAETPPYAAALPRHPQWVSETQLEIGLALAAATLLAPSRILDFVDGSPESDELAHREAKAAVFIARRILAEVLLGRTAPLGEEHR